jgi:hypothetical protein
MHYSVTTFAHKSMRRITVWADHFISAYRSASPSRCSTFPRTSSMACFGPRPCTKAAYWARLISLT